MKLPLVQFKNVTINQNKQTILSDVNFEVEPGEFIFLIGKTGTGKSSLIKTLYADLPLKIGTAQVSDFDLGKIKQKQIPFLRRKLGVVFQDFKLLNDRSIFENLSFVLKATGWKNKTEIKNRIEEVLSSLGVDGISHKYAFELSGGEQQRVAIARALLNSPELIIADEPTGNLDPQTSLEIMEVFRGLHQKGMTIIMATHDYNMIVKFPGKIFRCDDGKIYEVVQKKKPNEDHQAL
jgi:cell division transport system ATP-binding protein